MKPDLRAPSALGSGSYQSQPRSTKTPCRHGVDTPSPTSPPHLGHDTPESPPRHPQRPPQRVLAWSAARERGLQTLPRRLEADVSIYECHGPGTALPATSCPIPSGSHKPS